MSEEVKVETTETPEVEKVEETTKVEPTQVNAEEIKTQTKTEVLRDLSKELGVNVFEAEGLKQVKELIDSQKSEQEKLTEERDTLKAEREQWQKQKLNYESKLKASELGIHPSNLEDVLKLADNDPDKIADVVKKYPVFKSKDGIRIGVQDPDNHQEPTDKSEVEAYMEKYKNNKYYKKK